MRLLILLNSASMRPAARISSGFLASRLGRAIGRIILGRTLLIVSPINHPVVLIAEGELLTTASQMAFGVLDCSTRRALGDERGSHDVSIVSSTPEVVRMEQRGSFNAVGVTAGSSHAFPLESTKVRLECSLHVVASPWIMQPCSSFSRVAATTITSPAIGAFSHFRLRDGLRSWIIVLIVVIECTRI